MQTNWNKYIGIPFVNHGRDVKVDGGLDCWGLFRQIYLREQHVELGDMTDVKWSADDEDINNAAMQEITKWTSNQNIWRPIDKQDVEPFDGILSRIKGLPIHVGIVTSPNWFIHTCPWVGQSVREQYNAPFWEHRIIGVYRYVK